MFRPKIKYKLTKVPYNYYLSREVGRGGHGFLALLQNSKVTSICVNFNNILSVFNAKCAGDVMCKPLLTRAGTINRNIG